MLNANGFGGIDQGCCVFYRERGKISSGLRGESIGRYGEALVERR